MCVCVCQCVCMELITFQYPGFSLVIFTHLILNCVVLTELNMSHSCIYDDCDNIVTYDNIRVCDQHHLEVSTVLDCHTQNYKSQHRKPPPDLPFLQDNGFLLKENYIHDTIWSDADFDYLHDQCIHFWKSGTNESIRKRGTFHPIYSHIPGVIHQENKPDMETSPKYHILYLKLNHGMLVHSPYICPSYMKEFDEDEKSQEVLDVKYRIQPRFLYLMDKLRSYILSTTKRVMRRIAIIYTEPDSLPQHWHFDNHESSNAIMIPLSDGHKPTEFFKYKYM